MTKMTKKEAAKPLDALRVLADEICSVACAPIGRPWEEKVDSVARLLLRAQLEALNQPLAAHAEAAPTPREIEQAVKLAIENHEAELCPEDYGCAEYIAFLQKKLSANKCNHDMVCAGCGQNIGDGFEGHYSVYCHKPGCIEAAPTVCEQEELGKAFEDGVNSLRMLILEEMNKKDHVMPHTHNPDVQKAHQADYCWRCKIEKVLHSEFSSYHILRAEAAPAPGLRVPSFSPAAVEAIHHDVTRTATPPEYWIKFTDALNNWQSARRQPQDAPAPCGCDLDVDHLCATHEKERNEYRTSKNISAPSKKAAPASGLRERGPEHMESMEELAKLANFITENNIHVWPLETSVDVTIRLLKASQPQDAREAQFAVFRTLVEEALSYCLAQESSDWNGWIENAKEALK